MGDFPKILEIEQDRTAFLDSNRILVAFATEKDPEEVAALTQDFGLRLEEVPTDRNSSGVHINHTPQRFWLRSREPLDVERLKAIEGRLGGEVEWIGPVYGLPDKRGQIDLVCPLPNVLLILAEDRDRIEQGIGQFGLQLNEERSKFLNDYVLLELPDVRQQNAIDVAAALEAKPPVILFELMPMIRNLCAVPNDTHFGTQWNMIRIAGPQAWDIETGAAAVTVAVIDTGTDLTHPDLRLAGNGIDLGDMMSDGSPNRFPGEPRVNGHGTCCSGIVAAVFNNTAGVAGVAGGCSIHPVALNNWTNVELASGVNWAVAQGAAVVSLSIGMPQSGLVDTALANAFGANLVLCAATGNDDILGILYPARHPDVMAVGASDQVDNRKTTTSPDGETWGSNFGPEISVVAPGVRIPTTDIQGTEGYNTAAGGAGDYVMTFRGTSSATPHVAGLAALLRSQYPGATSAQIRDIIERSAEKVGTVAYAETPGRPNGTWNNEMGYGRINAFRALDLGDVMIKDWPGDTGAEPSTAGNFWDFSDIVVRVKDDSVFNPVNAAQSKNVERGQTNYIYVQVTNRGLREARNVAVSIRITPYVGLQFVYPQDWTAVDATHVAPTAMTGSFASVPAGSTVLAKFSVSATQVEALYGWETNNPWHPCLLAQVTADNDYAFATSALNFGNVVVRKNNFAQRNLTVIDVFAGATMAFPFVIGSPFSDDRLVRLEVDRSRLPKSVQLALALEGNESVFPVIDFRTPDSHEPKGGEGMVFEERTQLLTQIGGCTARLTLEKNSRLEMLCAHDRPVLKIHEVRGGERTVREGQEIVLLPQATASLAFEKAPNSIHALSLQFTVPSDAQPGDEYVLVVSQADSDDHTVGGATAIYRVPG